MSKDYKVKFTEIFQVPQNKTEIDDVLDDNEDANTPQSDDEDLIDEIKIKENSEKLNNCDNKKENEKVSDDDQKTSSTGRPKRLAAQKQRDKMKEILPCLKIQKKIIPENEQRSYRHGWNFSFVMFASLSVAITMSVGVTGGCGVFKAETVTGAKCVLTRPVFLP